MIHFREVIHYSERDKNCGGDYREIEIFMDDKLVETYGDHYHDKGRDKSEGFYDAVNLLLQEVEWDWETVQIADYEY